MCSNDEDGKSIVGDEPPTITKYVMVKRSINLKFHDCKDGFKKVVNCRECYYQEKVLQMKKPLLIIGKFLSKTI